MNIEPRGPDVLFAGLCVDCGHATVHRGTTGLPQCARCEQASEGEAQP